ncbi:hypothetical protein GCM10009536_40650 [Streptomyces thermocarboxydus]
MKATTDAPAVAHTAFGCLRMLPDPVSMGSMGAPIPGRGGMPAAGGERRTDGGMVGIYNSRLANLINASYIYLGP